MLTSNPSPAVVAIELGIGGLALLLAIWPLHSPEPRRRRKAKGHGGK